MMKKPLLLSVVTLTTPLLLGTSRVLAAEQPTSVQNNGADPNSAQTTVTTTLTLNQTVTKPVAPTGPGNGGADKVTDINGLFGIAYAPESFNASAQLSDDGQQEIPLQNTKSTQNKFNIGVQDKTRQNDHQWTLKAKLAWTGDTNGYMNGTTITASSGAVSENVNGTLKTFTGTAPVSTNASNLTIGQTAETEIMKSTNGQTMNGVYNYQFQSPKLVIPNVKTVTSGTYNGVINWNLENTPNP